MTVPQGTIGYLGCSMTLNARDGYVSARGKHEIWSNLAGYGGGSPEAWARDLSDRSAYWSAFKEAAATKPPALVWWQLCAISGDRSNLASAQKILGEIHRRAPNVPIYVSAQPTYSPTGHTCRIAGADGPSRMSALLEQIVGLKDPLVIRGPVIGPLPYPSQTLPDGCHANDAGELAMGKQLASFFDSAKADAGAPSSDGGGARDGGGTTPPASGPRGIYSLDQLVDEPFVDGVVMRTGWSSQEKSEGQYDFSKIEATIRAAQKANQSVTLDTFVSLPTYLGSKLASTWTIDVLGKVGVPWDEAQATALERFITAQSNFTIDGVALKDHPTLANVNASIAGAQSIRITRTLPPGYTYDKFEQATIRSLKAWASAYSKKNLFVGLFALEDGAKDSATKLRDKLLTEFDGVKSPKINFFIEYLTGSKPDTSSPMGKLIYEARTTTSIMMQACGEWSKQSSWSWCTWLTPEDTPADGFKLGNGTFGSTYFEMYPADLQNAAYRNQLQTWWSALHP